MTTTPPLLTELEAVNVMLSVIGEAPVNTLTGAATVDVIQAKAPNHVWTVDFVQDRLSRGSGIRLLTVLDEFTRESLCIRVERRLRAEDVRLTLEVLFRDYGIPAYLRSDNGSEFVAQCLQGWLKEQGTSPLFIEPGSPWQNGKASFPSNRRAMSSGLISSGRMRTNRRLPRSIRYPPRLAVSVWMLMPSFFRL